MTVGVKKQVMKLVETLPFKIQVDKGLQELDEGKGIPHEEVEQKLSRWLSKEWSNRPGERTIQKVPYPLRNQSVTYSRPFDSVAEDEWEG